MTGETSQTLDRGIRVLRELAEAHGGLTVTELAARLGVNRTVMYRLLATLEHHSLVRRDADSRVRLGLGVPGQAKHTEPEPDPVCLAWPGGSSRSSEEHTSEL